MIDEFTILKPLYSTSDSNSFQRKHNFCLLFMLILFSFGMAFWTINSAWSEDFVSSKNSPLLHASFFLDSQFLLELQAPLLAFQEREEQQDSSLEEQQGSSLEEQQGSALEEQQGSSLEEQQGSALEEQQDSSLGEQQDSSLKERQNSSLTETDQKKEKKSLKNKRKKNKWTFKPTIHSRGPASLPSSVPNSHDSESSHASSISESSFTSSDSSEEDSSEKKDSSKLIQDPLSYSFLEWGSEQTGVNPRASKVYLKEDGFHLAFEGEIVNFKYEKERLLLKNQQTNLLRKNSTTSRSSYFSSSDLSLYFSHRSSSFQKLIHKNLILIFNSQIRWSYRNQNGNDNRYSFLKLQSPSIDFAYLDFLFHPYFNLRIGNQLLPIGRINSRQDFLSYFSVRSPDIVRLIIPERWHENGIQIWGGSFDIPLFFLRYSLGIFNSLKAINDEGFSNFTPEFFVSGGKQNAQNVEIKNPALTGQLSLHVPNKFVLGASVFVGNTVQHALDNNNRRSRRFNANRNFEESEYFNKSFKTSVVLWESHLRYKTNFLIFNALVTQGIMYNMRSLPLSYDNQLEEYRDRDNDLESNRESGKTDSRDSNLLNVSRSPGQVAFGYYVSLGFNLLGFRRQKSKDINELVLFSRYSEYDLHYVTYKNLLGDKRLHRRVLTIGAYFAPAQKNFIIKSNYQIVNNALNEASVFIEGSLGFSF